MRLLKLHLLCLCISLTLTDTSVEQLTKRLLKLEEKVKQQDELISSLSTSRQANPIIFEAIIEHFLVVRPNNSTGTISPYDRLNIDVGVGTYFDMSTGTFTVPYSGTYCFYFQAMTNDNSDFVTLNVIIDGTRQEQFYEDLMDRDGIQLPNTVMHVNWCLPNLVAGTKIAVEIQDGSLYTDLRTFIHFFGQLVN